MIAFILLQEELMTHAHNAIIIFSIAIIGGARWRCAEYRS